MCDLGLCVTTRRHRQGGVVVQDRRFQLGELGTGIETEFVEQATPHRAGHAERADLVTETIERQHQLTGEPLPVGVQLDRSAEVVGDECLVTEVECQAETSFECTGVALTQPSGHPDGPRLAAQFRKRFSPAAQGAVEQTHRGARILRALSNPGGHLLLEEHQVELGGRRIEGVPTAPSCDEPTGGATRTMRLQEIAEG